ncbi:dTDP-glucose 4,6-dehydratase [Candidatus Methanoperedens nitratireducens]|uniref:dTDP-glucose 4,6-dehydratase n=1 Tax=Candidatus Methanoperedens nitratireducens TaxID=1392998 RepID=A0A284VUV6_9EURY|nr:dTDP-glucose 4,6-dehydratase [Candidatus Methanoperedens nitroreducens]SNQ62978.1 dTDP-glucose 4,6-dehydratase [Candidatus Methanoperedens nitroreducens]
MNNKLKILITGGAGFIGSNFVRYMVEKYPNCQIAVIDKLTYAGKMENLQDVIDKITFIKGDICNIKDIEMIGKCDFIFNFAAETHVDRSIKEGNIFVKTDVLGTYNLLEYARKHEVKKYIQISTDEVYGSTEKDSFYEEDILDPSSPYSASKAGADLLVKSFFKTYGLPILITRSSNNFGPNQYPEKLIPVLILNAIYDKPLPIYGNGLNVRDWIYVEDNCIGIDFVFRKGKIGEIYNIGAGNEKTNIEIANLILESLGKQKSLIQFVKDRLGHDFRYSLNCEKIKSLGWAPHYTFEDALNDTIKWYVENEWWWKPLISR